MPGSCKQNSQENDDSIWIRWIVISSRNDCNFKHCLNTINLHLFTYSYWQNRFNIYVTSNAKELFPPESNEENVRHHDVNEFTWCQPTCMLTERRKLLVHFPKVVCFSLCNVFVCVRNFFLCSIVAVGKTGRIFHMTLISVLRHYIHFGNNMLQYILHCPV